MSVISKKRIEEITNKFESLEPIIVVGDVGIDKYTKGEVRRISPEAPVPILEVEKEWETLGLASNIVNNLSSLKVESLICGVVGDDLRAGRFENIIEQIGLKTWGIVREKGRSTIYKERVTTATQQICRVDYESTSPISEQTEAQLLDRIKDFSEGGSAFILEDYSKGSLTKNLLQKTFELARSLNKIVCVDPGRHTHPSVYKGATLLKPNLIEAKSMAEALGYSKIDLSLNDIANILVEKLSLEKLVITLGKDGMAFIDTKKSGKLESISTVASEVYDVSGAGDTVISLLCSSLLCGASLEEACYISSFGAGVVVGKVGTATVAVDELVRHFDLVESRLH